MIRVHKRRRAPARLGGAAMNTDRPLLMTGAFVACAPPVHLRT